MHLTYLETLLIEGVAEAHRADLSDELQVREVYQAVRPEVVIHTAFRLIGPRMARDTLHSTELCARAASDTGARFLHLSTDALFSGRARPYREEDLPDPVHPYGTAKAAAEAAVRAALPEGQFCMVRTSILTGADPWDPRSQAVVDSARAGQPVPLFTDEIRCPVSVDDLARALWEMAGWERWEPLHHLAGPEAISRFGLGRLILAREGIDLSLASAASQKDFASRRPGRVVLDSSRATARLRTRMRPVTEFLASPAPGGPASTGPAPIC